MSEKTNFKIFQKREFLLTYPNDWNGCLTLKDIAIFFDTKFKNE